MADYQALHGDDPSAVGGYDLVGRLASGGQGLVYLGRRYDGRLVAVKVLHHQLPGSSGGDRYTLQREVEAARQVAPFCTAQILDAQLGEEPHYIISEFVDGPPLSRHVADHGPLTGAALDRLTIATATALVAIHRAGVVHRDLKPANILLGPDGPRVIDFGIARPASADTTQTSSLRGTPLYMAPEQFEGQPARAPSDVFAWAASMAFAATGRPPFSAPTMIAIAHRVCTGQADLDGVPEPLAGVLRGCLAIDPARRPGAPQLLMDLLGHPTEATADPVQALAVASRAMSGPPPAAPAPAVTPAPPASAVTPAASAPALTIPLAALPTSTLITPVPPAPGPRRPRGISVPALAAGTLVLVAAAVVGVGARQGWFDGSHTGGPASSGGAAHSGTGRSAPGNQPIAAGSTGTAAASGPGRSTGRTDGGPALPTAALGRWTGEVHSAGQGAWTARVTLARRDAVLDAVDLGCRSALTLTSRAATALTFHFQLLPGSDQTCAAAGTLTLIRLGDSMSAIWTDDAHPLDTAVGNLTRQ
jgi:hypothetical protein